MQKGRGFTIVELTITVTVIAILVSLSIIAYNKVQQDARDTTRRGNVAVITEALEKYYRENGEYPSVRSLANTHAGNTGTAVAAKLKIDVAVLKMPRMPANATNAITDSPTPTNDYISYIATSSSDNAACQSNVAGGCDEFALKYNPESGSTITIDSRHQIPVIVP